MRIVGGDRGGRRLVAPPGRATRPTSDRVREAMFSSLGEHVRGAHVLDLYAGSGALGLEALSRGAAQAVFVERDPRAAAVIRRNLSALQLDPGPVGVVVASVRSFCAAPRGGPFSVVLIDAPYDVSLAEVLEHLTALHDAGALVPGARVVLERPRRDEALDAKGQPRADLPAFLAFDRVRSYGDTVLVHVIVRQLPADAGGTLQRGVREGVDREEQDRR